jgi:lambda repressor-like predicted transcriptional regulator
MTQQKTREAFKAALKRRGIPIRWACYEIGISRRTLQRFLAGRDVQPELAGILAAWSLPSED